MHGGRNWNSLPEMIIHPIKKNSDGQNVAEKYSNTAVPEERAGEEPVIAVKDVTMQFGLR